MKSKEKRKMQSISFRFFPFVCVPEEKEVEMKKNNLCDDEIIFFL